MTVGSFNNSIGFPRLTNNSSGMFMMPAKPVTPQAPKIDINLLKPTQPSQPVQQVVSAPAPVPTENSSHVSNTSKDNSNYWIGALAVAAAVVAGIYLNKGKKAEETVEDVKNVLPKVNKPHIKDNFLKALGVNDEEVSVGVRKEYDLVKTVMKAGDDGVKRPVVVRHGIKRVESISGPSNMRKTTFEKDNGVVLAEVFRDMEGNVCRYKVQDDEGRILREYDAEDGITKKFVYNKKGTLVSEVKYDCEGYSVEKRYNPETKLLDEEISFGENPEDFVE